MTHQPQPETDAILNAILQELHGSTPETQPSHSHSLTMKHVYIFLSLLDVFFFYFFLYYTDLNTQYQLNHGQAQALQLTSYALYSVCFFILAVLLSGFILGFIIAKRIITKQFKESS